MVDERVKVFDLPLDLVGQGVATVASAASVVHVHPEVPTQKVGQVFLRATGAGDQGSVDQDQCRSFALFVVRDGRAVS